MAINCSNVLDSLKTLDWVTIKKTIGNNHSTIIGAFASWFVKTSGVATVIEGAPSFSTKGSKAFKSDGLFCEDEAVVGILEVEGSRHDHTTEKLGKHFRSNSPILANLRFAIYVAYPESPTGRGERRNFPPPLTDNDFQRFCKLSREHPQKCIVVITLHKLFERNLSEVRKKTEYYSGHIASASARVYRNGNVGESIQLFGASG